MFRKSLCILALIAEEFITIFYVHRTLYGDNIDADNKLLQKNLNLHALSIYC